MYYLGDIERLFHMSFLLVLILDINLQRHVKLVYRFGRKKQIEKLDICRENIWQEKERKTETREKDMRERKREGWEGRSSTEENNSHPKQHQILQNIRLQ